MNLLEVVTHLWPLSCRLGGVNARQELMLVGKRVEGHVQPGVYKEKENPHGLVSLAAPARLTSMVRRTYI